MLFEQEKVYLTTAQLFALWRGVGKMSSDPAIGLKLGGETRLARSHPAGIAVLCSRTFEDALPTPFAGQRDGTGVCVLRIGDLAHIGGNESVTLACLPFAPARADGPPRCERSEGVTNPDGLEEPVAGIDPGFGGTGF